MVRPAWTLLLFLSLSAFGTIGERTAVSSFEPVYGAGFLNHDDDTAVIATNGDSFFAVWQEVRDHGVVRGALLDAHGNAIGGDGITLVDAFNPRVAWNGYAWAVMWKAADGHVHGRLYDRDALPLEGSDVLLPRFHTYMAELVTAGDRLAYLEPFGPLLLMNREMQLLREIALPSFTKAIASDGDGFLILEAPGTLLRLDHDGNTIGTSSVYASYPDRARILWDGGHYVLWTVDSTAPAYASMTIITRDGKSGVPRQFGQMKRYVAFSATIAYAITYDGKPVALRRGADLNIDRTTLRMPVIGVATNERGQSVGIWGTNALRGGRIGAADGAPEDDGQWLVRNTPADFAAGADVSGASPLLAYIVDEGSQSSVIVCEPLKRSAPVVLDRGPDRKDRAHLAAGAATTLVAWAAHPTPFLMMIEIALLEHGKLPRRIHIATEFGATDFAVVWSGTAYLAVWSEFTKLRMVRIDVDARRQYDTPILIAAAPQTQVIDKFAVARGGNVTLLVWAERFRTCYCAGTVRSIRIDSNGGFLDAAPVTLSSTDYASTPAVTWNGKAFVVAWNRDHSIEIVNVTPGGTVIPMPSLPRVDDAIPSLASHGTHTYLAWESSRRIDVVRVDEGGAFTFLGGFATQSHTGAHLVRLPDALLLLYDEGTPDTDFTRHVWMRAITSEPAEIARRRTMTGAR